MENIYQISQTESKCTGCGACMNVCPHGAIRMVARDGYFVYPEIDVKLCNKCGLCLKKCPSAPPAQPGMKTDGDFPKIYGGYVQDETIRKESSSGGVFTVLAEYMLKRGGVVCGAAFATRGTEVLHIIVDKRSELPRLRGSKYVQSSIGMVYRELLELLKKGKSVLFIGTPCQVAALKSVVSANKWQEQLLTVDLLCAGAPPQKLFTQFVNAVTGGQAETAHDIKMRDKTSSGWHDCTQTLTYQGGVYRSHKLQNPYFRVMKARLSARKSCWNCRYAQIPRQGDFSLGDLWGVAETALHITDEKGVSAICINNEKASQILQEIRPSLALLERVEIDAVGATNNLRVHCYPHPNYERFWDYLRGGGDFISAVEKFTTLADGIAILNFHDSRGNYGSALTGFAMQEIIRKMVGFAPVHISLWDGFKEEISDLRDFTKENILETRPCWSDSLLRNYNKYFQTFIVGPDVVWKNCGYFGNFNKFFLDFVEFSKNIASYAPSFKTKTMTDFVVGKGEVEVSPEQILERKRLLKRFTHISVREDFGVDICRDIFDVNAELVLDPTLLLDAEDYMKLMRFASEEITSETIVTYFLNRSNISSGVVEALEDGRPVKNMVSGGDYSDLYRGQGLHRTGVKMADWLRLIHDCKCLATDSYHGMIFAIVFRKPFILIRHSKESLTVSYKLDSLLKLLGIENRFADSKADFERLLATEMDWVTIERNLAKWREKSENYLAKVLADNKPNPTRQWLESLEILDTQRMAERNAAMRTESQYGYIERIVRRLFRAALHPCRTSKAVVSRICKRIGVHKNI